MRTFLPSYFYEVKCYMRILFHGKIVRIRLVLDSVGFDEICFSTLTLPIGTVISITSVVIFFVYLKWSFLFLNGITSNLCYTISSIKNQAINQKRDL